MFFDDQIFPVERRTLAQVNRDNAARHGTHVVPQSAYDAHDADKIEVKFEGASKITIGAETDAEIERAAKKVKGWKEGQEFPSYTLYRNGEEVGGG